LFRKPEAPGGVARAPAPPVRNNNGLLAALNAIRPGNIDLKASALVSGGNAGGLSYLGGQGKFGNNDIAAMSGGDSAPQSGPQAGRQGGNLSALADMANVLRTYGTLAPTPQGQASAEGSTTRRNVHTNKESWIYNTGTGPARKRGSKK
jgi:hypothetical protein